MRSMTFLEMNYNSLLAWDYLNLPFKLLSPTVNMSFISTIRNMFFNTKLYELQLKLFPVLVELHEQMKSIPGYGSSFTKLPQLTLTPKWA